MKDDTVYLNHILECIRRVEEGAFRNILVHNYLGIDLEQVWVIIHHDIPPLKEAVTAMLVASAEP